MLHFSAEKRSYNCKTALAIKMVALVLAVTLTVTLFAACAGQGTTTGSADVDSSQLLSSEESTPVSSETASSEFVSSTQTVSSSATTSKGTPSKKPTTSTTTSSVTIRPITGTNYDYNTNLDIEDNVFFDSMIYTGYNIEKHRADGKMWVYILAARKRGMGWLSNITYGGGCTGYETKNGKPDIARFERGGLVCASYVTYVYFNYLPNVAGIDTSSLTRPVQAYSANDWYIAAKDWIKKGYAKEIKWKASLTSAGAINFQPAESIPIGSIIAFRDARYKSDHCSHVVVYAGYKNGYHWVFHVGNENGPEFCAVERMHYGPDPQWPLMVITTPHNIRFSASIEMSVKDESGAALPGAKCTITNKETKKSISLGTTDKSGKLSKDLLSYGDYTVSITLPDGYTATKPLTEIKLTTLNNSLNQFTVTAGKAKSNVESKAAAKEPETPTESVDNTDTPQE